jgi:hypothetical protein
MFKCHQIQSNHIVSRKNEADTYGASVFAPNYSATVLAAKMHSNSNEHSLYIRFLWISHQPMACTINVLRS